MLVLGGAFLAVVKTTGFLESSYFNTRQKISNAVIQNYMQVIGMAQTQIYQRSKELEFISQKLALSNEELARLNDMKSKFLSMVVHDVRSPLASIKGFSELLMKIRTDEKSKIYADNVIKASEHMARLVSDLTDLAMIEAGKLRIEKSLFHFPDAATYILPSMRVHAEKQGVILIEHPLLEGIYVNGDRFRLSQVLMNLLNNAIKFTPAGKTVELMFRKEGQSVLTIVKDSGIGLHPSDIQKVFEKFYQAQHQKDENLREKGWGLGLSIAQEIVHAHKGEIWVNSKGLGKGSTFIFKVPMA